jgi:cytochrome c biogenesis protein CcmG/thiol:disulfide interchange protein DsbE
VLGVLALLAYGVASTGDGSDIDDAVARGERVKAPSLDLARLGGGRASLEDFRGQVVVLNFWASWCDPCRAESPLLQRWHERMRPRGGTVLGVDVRDVSSDALGFVREYRLTYPHLRDVDEEAMRDYDVPGLPETFVIDRQGRIAAIKRAPVDDRFLREAVPPLLEEAP